MVRDIDPALLAAMAAPVWYPVMLLDLDWPLGRIRAHSGTGTITFGGDEYLGVGRFGAVTPPGEAFGMAAQPIDVALFGLPPEVLDEITAPTFNPRNRRGTSYIAASTEPGGNVLIGTPYPKATGYVDAVRYTLRRQGEERQHGVQVSLGVGPSARAAAVLVHSAEDQQSRHPADTAGRWLVNARRRVEVMTWPQS
jgi:hypothetical protein